MYTMHMACPLLSVQWSFYYLNSLSNGKLKPIDLYTEFHSNTLIEHTHLNKIYSNRIVTSV